MLEWSRSHWGEGIAAKGGGGYYLVMIFASTALVPGRYVASHRSCFSHEPHYFGRFALHAEGLQAAMRACQAREDCTSPRLEWAHAGLAAIATPTKLRADASVVSPSPMLITKRLAPRLAAAIVNVLMRCYINPMKHKDHVSGAVPAPQGESLARLMDAILAMRSASELQAFLEDLCTPAEIEALADRWRVVPLLLQGMAYREIHDRTGVSVTTVGRIARCLSLGAGGYRLAAKRVLHGTGAPSA